MADMQYNSFDDNSFGSTMWDFAKTSTLFAISDPLMRMGGYEYGLFPGARRFRHSVAGKGGGFGNFLGFGSRIGFFPNRLDDMTLPGRVAAYRAGTGPVFERGGERTRFGKAVNRVTDTVNRAWIGHLDQFDDELVTGVYRTLARGAPRGGTLKGMMYWRGVAKQYNDAPGVVSVKNSWFHNAAVIDIDFERGGPAAIPSNLHGAGDINASTGKPFGARGPGATSTAMATEVAYVPAYNRRVARKIGQFEFRSSLARTVGKFAAVMGYVQTAMWAASVVSGIVRAGHDYGAARLDAKHTAPKMINTPSGASLRMQAMQNAALSFGAVRAAIGNEAMANHRY